ncbi:MAG: aminotransferase class III-fold pyridoxal phosphate-dependent enzyme [Methanomicrobiales archaeon]|nr:aminotransferase class III-fold pyridoxal phosphate-dependent enzyme [Methanomicrobiales archaeon]
MRGNRGIALWKKAKTIIPGGSQLLSKRSEIFLPDLWPSYYSRAKGISIWDLDGHRYTDMSIMGVGACILGYADPDVNRAVMGAVRDGSMATLNCPEEVELAELLLSLHPWAGMVRYARSGGEAMAIAVRIARAFSGRDTVAFCGYHGWHDWYLSSNLAEDSNLDGHLLPGLLPLGVPRGIANTAIPFEYNRLDQLEEVVEGHDIGVIAMEPVRHHLPEPGFLEGVRKIADREDAVLIFDEITSGWRMNVGGVHATLGVPPDLAVYAKGIANGYPMAAVVGRSEVMEKAQESFISSTFWTERVGPVAALATIRKMRRLDVPSHLIRIGTEFARRIGETAGDASLLVHVAGIPPLTSFSFDHPENQVMQTLFTQEMLERDFLASKNFYVALPHTEKEIDRYMDEAAEVFSTIRAGLEKGNLKRLLRGPVAHEGFRRLT